HLPRAREAAHLVYHIVRGPLPRFVYDDDSIHSVNLAVNLEPLTSESGTGTLSHIDVRALAFLFEGRERNPQSFGRRRLAPLGGFQLLDDLTAFVISHDFKQRRVRRQAAARV